MTAAPITIYGQNNCYHCLRAKQLAESFQFKITYKDIGANEDAKREFLELFPGQNIVPVILWNHNVLVGFDAFAREIENTMNNYGEEKL